MGDNPPEDPEELLSEIHRSFTELQRLICAIDKTNATAQLEGRSLAAVLTERAMLKSKQRILLALIDHSSIMPQRQTKSEIRFVSTIKASRLQKQADELGTAFRQLDLKLQAANWSIELAELAESEMLNSADKPAETTEE